LLEQLSSLNRLATTAHFAGPSHYATWHVLDHVYRQLPELRVELVLLEESPAGALVRFFSCTEEERASQIAEVHEAGGISNWEGKFVAVET